MQAEEKIIDSKADENKLLMQEVANLSCVLANLISLAGVPPADFFRYFANEIDKNCKEKDEDKEPVH